MSATRMGGGEPVMRRCNSFCAWGCPRWRVRHHPGNGADPRSPPDIMPLPRRSLLGLIPLLSIGCAGDGEPPAHVVRDSAGVRIAESTRPGWKSGTSWTLDSTLSIIGAGGTGAGQVLHRVTGAVRLSNGALVIADGGSQQLFRYDPRSTF